MYMLARNGFVFSASIATFAVCREVCPARLVRLSWCGLATITADKQSIVHTQVTNQFPGHTSI